MITDSLTTILLATSIILISLKGFKNPLLFEKYLFSPERILAGKEYYRLISSGFFHVDQKHLIFNSITLFLFGESIEKSAGFFPFLILFFTSVLGGNLLSLYIHRHHHYRAAGASGGISGLIIGSVILSPGGKIGSLFLPDMFMIPDYLFALLFFAGSIYAAHYRNDNIGHDAHLGGGITGLLISSVLNPAGVMVRPFVFAFITVMLSFYLFYLIKTKGGLIPFHIFSGNLFRKSKKTGTAPVSNKRLNRQQKKIRVVHTKDFRDEVDEILKKISLSGIESLTKEERAKLEEGSKKMKESRD